MIVRIIILFYFMSFLAMSDSNAVANNHSFIFITGWPQSGTSLVQQFMTTSPVISTMMQKCENLLGKRCVGWNHEGQWLLPGKTRQFFNSGAMCPVGSNVLSTDQQNTVLDEWGRFWNLDKPYLAEKSPQSLLKIPMLRQVTEKAVKTKFLIILKNPVSLNVATPKNADWTHFRSNAAKSLRDQTSDKIPEKIKISQEQREINAKFFIDFMSHNRSNVTIQAECSLGYIPAMETLHQQLISDNVSRSDVRIIRYEQFDRPNLLCKAIFRFIFDSHNSLEYNSTVIKVCNEYFPKTSAPASYSSNTLVRSDGKTTILLPGTRSRPSDMIKQGNVNKLKRKNSGKRMLFSTDNRLEADIDYKRRLRMRNYQDTKSVKFIPELVTISGKERMKEYVTATSLLPRRLGIELMAIDKSLRRFGYSLTEWSHHAIANNLFTPWEILLD